MSEIITTYLLNDLEQPLPMDRGEFYASQIKIFKEGKMPNRSAAIVQVLLFSPDKDIILQKRSFDKTHNPGLIDKTIGGHVTFGNTFNFSVQAETLQEMQVPSIVLSYEEDFSKTYRLLKDFLSNSAIIQLIDRQTANFSKLINDQLIPIANTYYFYLGVYGGSIRPADREASGVLFYTLENLQKEMKKMPEMFTEDLKFFLSKYSSEIELFLSKIA